MTDDTWFSVKSFQIKNIYDLNESKSIKVNQKYQRSKIWKQRQKSDLIDSILRGYPIGAITAVQRTNYLELVDGQQRLFAIFDFMDDHFPSTRKKFFSKLDAVTKSKFLNYSIPTILINPSLTLDKISSIFVRLQEGTPLSTAEKVFAFVGSFRTAFMDAFYAETNAGFFNNLPNNRFRACLVSAHLLTIELESNFKNETFSDLDYASLKTINETYKSKEFPYATEKNFNKNIEFISKHLSDVVKKIKLREITPLYLLVSYMRWNNTLDGDKSEFLRECFIKLDEDLGKFSIYDDKRPKDLDEEVFQELMSYKAYSRQGLSGSSLKERLKIIKSQYKRTTGKKP